MTGMAELHIIFDADMFPAGATCQICGAEMPNQDNLGNSKKDRIESLAAEFDLHMRDKHIDRCETRSVRNV
jgi:hypothetical protein